MIRVVLADDQVMVRSGLRLLLEVEPDVEVVAEAGDGAEAVASVTTTVPDVVLMDVRMPDVDGVEATRRIVASGVATKVVMLTTFDDDEVVFASLRAGASGFLLKNAPPEELVEAVRVVASGDALLSPSVTARVIAAVGEPADGVDPAARRRLDVLTERELEVLAELARGGSNAEIAAALFVSEATVKTHVSNVLAKLGLRDRVQAVIEAYETGLVTPGG